MNREKTLPFLRQRPLIMGILNATPDSFSGDGLLGPNGSSAATLRQAELMVANGADIIDIGGESTRPGASPVSADEELRRTIPVIEALRRQMPVVPLSIDTMKPEVAAQAATAGATIINDVSGTQQAPSMLKLAARHGVYLVLMHNSSHADAVIKDAHLGAMYEAPSSGDIVSDVKNQLKALANNAIKAGIAPDKIIIDPGLGFGKTVEQNLRLMNELDKLKELGFPVLAGPSRKSFIGRTLDLPVDDRLEGTAACVAACVMRGADILRVHDVKELARVASMANAISRTSTIS